MVQGFGSSSTYSILNVSLNRTTYNHGSEKQFKPTDKLEKSPEEEKADQIQIDKLKQRDREVRAHEQAHISAGGSLVRGGPTFDYQYGPDGKKYAIGGHVSIDTSPGKTPEETIQKAEQIANAALAVGDPSSQDRAVASGARKMKLEAQRELQIEKQEELKEGQSDQQKYAENIYLSEFNFGTLVNFSA